MLMMTGSLYGRAVAISLTDLVVSRKEGATGRKRFSGAGAAHGGCLTCSPAHVLYVPTWTNREKI